QPAGEMAETTASGVLKADVALLAASRHGPEHPERPKRQSVLVADRGVAGSGPATRRARGYGGEVYDHPCATDVMEIAEPNPVSERWALNRLDCHGGVLVDDRAMQVAGLQLEGAVFQWPVQQR